MTSARKNPPPAQAPAVTPAQKRAAVRSFTCGKCGAPPGRACRNPGGGTQTVAHADRYAQAFRAGRLK